MRVTLEHLNALESAQGTAARATDVLPEVARDQPLLDWNRTEADHFYDRCVHQLFEAQVVRNPDATAALFEGASLSYGELNIRANRLAHHLRSLGVIPDARVAICMKRSLEMVVGLLAILKAGGSYVPLDPAYPAQRLGFMLHDSAPMAVLCHAPARSALGVALEELGKRPTVLDLEADAGRWADLPVTNPDPRTAGLTSSHLAYVIYTSGSTGTPKGVMVEHRNLVNYLNWARNEYCLASGIGSPVNTSVAFDATVSSLIGPLVSGGLVHLLPEGDGELNSLAESLEAGRGYSIVKLTPSHLQLLQQLRPSAARNEAASVFVIGGEALTWRHVAFWRERAPGIRLINEYGPTEATVGVVIYEVTPGTPSDGPIPIGRPIWNTRIYLLDERRQLVPRGSTGEIYIGGRGVARGYLNRPELTTERFIASPFVEGDRLYKTGDLGRYLPDGNIEFLGRNDFQVKIRGLRIELGEIEARLAEHSAVRDAVVLAREDDPGDTRLVAYYTGELNISAEALRAHALATLPNYMAPSAFVRLQKLPLTPNGKIDRNALPAPEAGPHADYSHAAAVNDIEERVAQISAGLLKSERVAERDTSLPAVQRNVRALTELWYELLPAAWHAPMEETFWELGGDSLKMVQLSVAVEKITNRYMPLTAFLFKPTLQYLCEVVHQSLLQEGTDVQVFRAHGSRRPMFFIHSIDGIVAHYSTLADALGDDQPIFGLKSPALSRTGILPGSIEEAAAEMILRIRKITPDSAPAIVGYSSSGLLAFEVARQWIAGGLDPPFVGLIGSNPPLRIMSRGRRLVHFLRWLPNWVWRALFDSQKWADVLGRLPQIFRRTGAILGKRGHRPQMPSWATSKISQFYAVLEQKYQPPQDLPIQIDLFRESESRPFGGHPLHPLAFSHLWDAGWTFWTGVPPRIYWADASHQSVMVRPNVEQLAVQLRKAMDAHYRI
jgi:amino acid adenylation domain-containing protein